MELAVRDLFGDLDDLSDPLRLPDRQGDAGQHADHERESIAPQQTVEDRATQTHYLVEVACNDESIAIGETRDVDACERCVGTAGDLQPTVAHLRCIAGQQRSR